MTETTAAAELRGGRPGDGHGPALGRVGDFLLRSILPLVLALGTGAIISGRSASTRSSTTRTSGRGLRVRGVAGHGHAVAPLLLIAVGLIVVFKAGIWNLGMDGQFLLAAAVIAGSAAARAPPAERGQPRAPVPRRRRGRRRVDDRARGAEGTLRAQRDHHDADDDLHRHQPRADPRQGDVPGPTTTTPQTRAFDFSRCCRRFPVPSRTRRWPGIHVGVLALRPRSSSGS